MFLIRDGISQTEDTGKHRLFDPANAQSESKGIQVSPQYRETGLQAVREAQEKTIQTERLGKDGSVQTMKAEMIQKGSQAGVLMGDMSVQTLPPPQMADAELQVVLKGGEDSWVQTAEPDLVDTASETELHVDETGMQTVSPVMADIGLLVKIKGGRDTHVQTFHRELPEASSQTLYLNQDISVQTMAAWPDADTGSQAAFPGTDISSQSQKCKVTNSFTPNEAEEIGKQGLKADVLHQISRASDDLPSLNKVKDGFVQTVTTDISETSCQTQFNGEDESVQTVPLDSTSVGSQTQYKGTDSGTQTGSPQVTSISSQTLFCGQYNFTQTPLPPDITNTSSQTEKLEINSHKAQRTDSIDLLDVGMPLRHSPDYAFDQISVDNGKINSDISVNVQKESCTSETEPGNTSVDTKTDLEGQVVALSAAVSGLKAQLMTERESHRKQVVVLEREVKQIQRSMSFGRESEVSGPV